MSFNEIDDTLVAYFRQMLDEETAQSDVASKEEPLTETEKELSALQQEVTPIENDENTEVKSMSAADDIDYAADDYVPPALDQQENYELHNSYEPELQTQAAAQEETSSLPFAEHKSLQTLLENVSDTDTKTEVETETKTAEPVAEVKTEVAEPEVKEETKVEETTADVRDETPAVVKDKTDETPHENPYEWENIEMPSEFQALFFLVKGIRFAVPLVNLGGIFQCEKITPLFGKPKWFMGIADIRGKKMNVVDTLKWVKSDAPLSDKYEYMIALDKTLWSIGCDELEGNRILSKDSVTWRQTAGNRPWLAGIVKKEMCALLHVDALIKMFENGVNLKDLDQQVGD